MPPVSQGMVVQVPVSLSGHTLSALSLLISVPSLIASARCRSRDGLSLGTNFMPSSSSSSSVSPNPTMFKSRRRFLKLFGNACTTCGARSCLGAEFQRVCEDPQCSSPSTECEENSFRKGEGGAIGRRTFGAGVTAGTVAAPFAAAEFAARALGDMPVTIEQVTPPIAPSGNLYPAEERTVDLFERNTYSVVNIFDVTLRPQVNMTGSVEVPEGNGSGFIWDAEGHIVTNYHVIGSSLARNPSPGKLVARVTLLGADGYQKNFEATLVGADRTKDLAVLKVNAPIELLRPVNLGQSSRLRVGQRCLAIGNPFGFDHTLTVGVVSGLNRDIQSQTGVVIGGGIQTDAAINPGNSGGPLLDSGGNIIGINTAIFTRTGTSAGVGFAIPIDTVAKLVPQLIVYGKVMRPGLNVQLAPEPVARQLNVRSGALVLSVPGTSAAAKAGLKPTRRGLAGNIVLGDVIVAVGESLIINSAELAKVLDGYQVGDQVVLKVQRDDSLVELPFTLEESVR
ncbi:unnamed protein product [Sphagnum troendelagicum]|uniref:PDZ domain-containing protein n=1 Tax=Sphagnum troendelagicum TaxID=128251 RepID=A0ABP0TWM3_9BRYO